MRFENVCLEGLGYVLPGEVLTSDQLEHQLSPLYQRLRLPAGRLELMSGISARRLFQPGTLPSQISIRSVKLALQASSLPTEQVGALVHASVCRDHLEPATACLVHAGCGLKPQCLMYDVSNACLGFLNGLIQVASLIELGVIGAGVVVSTEDSRGLVEATVQALNDDDSLSRGEIKHSMASLTIGSASVAGVLVDRRLSQTGTRLQGGIWWSDTTQNHLCRSTEDQAGGGMRPLMTTDAERLMQAGIAVGKRAFGPFLEELRWDRGSVDRTICHQVGLTHRKLMLEALQLESDRDYTTVQTLGNTGSAALPATLAIALEQGFIRRGERVALLGIGSGINTVMLGAELQSLKVCSEQE